MDETGAVTSYVYDTLKRVKTATKEGSSLSGYPSQGAMTTTFTYNTCGQVLGNVVTGGSLSQSTSTVFDLLGRATSQTTPDQLTSTTRYDDGGRTVTVTNGALETKVTVNYLDRRFYSITGSAVTNQFYDYTLSGLGFDDALYPKNVTTVTWGSATAQRQNSTVTDHRYVTDEEIKPAFRDSSGVSKVYSFNGGTSLPATMTETGLEEDWVTEYQYDSFGEKTNETRVIDPGNSDLSRVQSFAWGYRTNSSGHWFKFKERSTYPAAGVQVLMDKTEERISGLGTNDISETYTYDPEGNQTSVKVTANISQKKVTKTTTVPESSLVATEVSVNGLLQTATTATVSQPTWHYYDSLAREIGMVDPLGFASGTRYDATTGQVIATTNRNTQVTTFAYYAAGGANAGLLYYESGPTGKKTYHDYNSRGQPTKTWGDVPYPELRTYNDFGDLVTLTTYRNGSGWNGATWPTSPGTGDVTTWVYDEPTGLLISKVDALGRAVTFDYYNNHLPKSRHWQRGGSTTSFYSQAGDLTRIDQDPGSGTVTSVTMTDYNRLGLAKTVIDDSGTHTLSYDSFGRVLADHCTAGLLNGVTVGHRFDGFMRKQGVDVTTSTGTVSTDYGYDSYGRLSTVTQGSGSASYTYKANSGLVETVTSGPLLATKTYDYGYRLASVVNTVSGRVVTSHSYHYDALDRRDMATLQDQTSWIYGYNDRDELTNGKHYWEDASLVRGQQFQYGYDNIGNRSTVMLGDSGLGTLRSVSYFANSLNEYSTRGVPTYLDILGIAQGSATVTVNSQSTFRRNEYFHALLAVGNGGGAQYPQISVAASWNGQNLSSSGNIFVPAATETFVHDLDGNLAQDGRWNYTWDGENRLVRMDTVSASPEPQRTIEFKYDHLGRRCSKRVTNSGTVGANLHFVYDGWNLVAELNGADNTLLRSYGWGLDIANSLPGDTEEDSGAGIGGLTMLFDYASGMRHFPAFDGNGNVTGLVQGNGAISARYEYSGFGETIRMTGPAADLNPFRWSTRFTEKESELILYPSRYYCSGSGSWLNRDSLGEKGGANLLAFVKNSPIGNVDPLGAFNLLDQETADAVGGYLDSTGAGQALGIYQKAKQIVEMSNEIVQTGEGLMDAIAKTDWDQFSVHIDSDDLFIAAATSTLQAFSTAVQQHHTMTTRHAKWTPAFDQFLGTVGLSINGTFINILNVGPVQGHSGPHEKYNALVYDFLTSSIAKGKTKQEKTGSSGKLGLLCLD